MNKSPIIQVEFTNERVLAYAQNLLNGDDTNVAFEKVFRREPTAKDIVALETHPEYHSTVDAVRSSVVQTALTNAVGFYAEGMKTMWKNFQRNQSIVEKIYLNLENMLEDPLIDQKELKPVHKEIERYVLMNNQIYKELRNKHIELTQKTLNSGKDEHEDVWAEFD